MVQGPVITAYSLCNGLGVETAEVLRSLREGRRGLRPCPLEVPFTTVCGAVTTPLPAPPPALAAHDTRVLRLALAGFQGVAAATERAIHRYGATRVALIGGTSTGGIGETEVAYAAHLDRGELPTGYDYGKQHHFTAAFKALARHVGIEGPVYAVSTACSSSAKNLASAWRLIDLGVVDAVLTAGVDGLCLTTVRGFHSLGVLAEQPCAPFNNSLPGMNVGEGAAFLLLERNGEGCARLAGVGESSDAFHMSAPDPEGRGATLAMRRALDGAQVDPGEIDLINAHGTGTVHNDSAEAKALTGLFGAEVPMISTKGYTGHMLGAAGGTEAALSIMMMEGSFVPPSVGASTTENAGQLDVVHTARSIHIGRVLSNSFAFGGNNAAIVLERT